MVGHTRLLFKDVVVHLAGRPKVCLGGLNLVLDLAYQGYQQHNLISEYKIWETRIKIRLIHGANIKKNALEFLTSLGDEVWLIQNRAELIHYEGTYSKLWPFLKKEKGENGNEIESESIQTYLISIA